MTEQQLASTTNAENRPPIPKIAYTVINPLMKLILRSPFHGLISDDLMLITFTGRKTGKRYTTPVGYVKMKESVVIFTESPWWRNIQGGASVTLRLRGYVVSGNAEIITNPDIIRNFIQRMIQKRGPEMAERMGFAVDPGQAVMGANGRKFIQITFEKDIG